MEIVWAYAKLFHGPLACLLLGDILSAVSYDPIEVVPLAAKMYTRDDWLGLSHLLHTTASKKILLMLSEAVWLFSEHRV
jgi:hypothetical protein